MNPNWMLALEPGADAPFAMWLAGAFALMVTELLRVWSDAAPFRFEP